MAYLPSATTQAPVSVATSMIDLRLELLHVGQRVAEDQAAFGVGVEHFDRSGPDIVVTTSLGR